MIHVHIVSHAAVDWHAYDTCPQLACRHSAHGSPAPPPQGAKHDWVMHATSGAPASWPPEYVESHCSSHDVFSTPESGPSAATQALRHVMYSWQSAPQASCWGQQ